MRIEGKGKENNMVGWWSTLSWSSDTFHNFFLSFPTASVIDAAFKFFFEWEMIWCIIQCTISSSLLISLSILSFSQQMSCTFLMQMLNYLYSTSALDLKFDLDQYDRNLQVHQKFSKTYFFNFMTSIIHMSPVPVE